MARVVHVEARSAAGPDAVFALLADTRSWLEWSPMVAAEVVETVPGIHPEGVGALRRFKAPRRRTWSVERVVRYEPGRAHSYELVSGLAIRDYLAEVILRPDGDGTAITWHSTFEAKVPGTGWLYRSMLQTFITDTVDRLARAATSTTSPSGRSGD